MSSDNLDLISYGKCNFCGEQLTWFDINSANGRFSSDNKQICHTCSENFIKSYSKHYLKDNSVENILISEYSSDNIEKLINVKVTCPNCNGKIDNKNSRYCDQCGYELNPPKVVIKMVCKKCGGEYSESKKYCSNDGTKLTKQKTEISDIDEKTSPTKPSLKTKVDNTEYSGFTHKLSTGGYGLFKTYWLFNVLIGAICSVIISLFESLEAVAILTTLFYIYGFIVLLGTWNAANKYNGYKLWAILAKFSVIIGLIVMIVSFIYMVSLL